MANTVTFSGWSGGTLTLNDQTKYRIRKGWRPKVATERESVLGGRAIHEEIMEEMPLSCTGGTAAEALANLNNLAKALEQARRWKESEGIGVNPVIFNFKPDGSSLAQPTQSVVLGTDMDSSELLGLTPV